MSESSDTYACATCTYIQSKDVLKCEMVSWIERLDFLWSCCVFLVWHSKYLPNKNGRKWWSE